MTVEPKRGTTLDASEKNEIAVLAAQGMAPYSIAKVLGRSPTTIKKHLQTPEVAAQKESIEERLAEKFEQLTERVLDGVTAADIEKASLRDKAIAAGVMLDKSRLIRGQSTANMAVLMASAVVEADASDQTSGPGGINQVNRSLGSRER